MNIFRASLLFFTSAIHAPTESFLIQSFSQSKKVLTKPKPVHFYNTKIYTSNLKTSPLKMMTTASKDNHHQNKLISISSAFDGGNGKLDKVVGNTVYINIEKDPYTELERTEHFQYFNFRSTVAVEKLREDHNQTSDAVTLKYVLSNAKQCSYPIAWDGTTTFVSNTPYDPHSWRRIQNTSYDASTGELSWTYDHSSTSSSVYFSYFPPYSYCRHLSLIAKCDASPSAKVYSLGQSLEGREMDCVQIGSGKLICWIIHRQHPGETMAEFYAEGLLERLLGLNMDGSVDGLVKDILQKYTFYIVPNMCPDGGVRGHLRTNFIGSNLNREWTSSGSKEDGTFYDAPTLERSPEVYYVLKKMDETGVDAFLDVHGDEELPFNFLAGSEGCANWSKRLEVLHGAFLSKYSEVNSDMQALVAYEPEEPGQGRTNVCSNQIAIRFDCLAATLEQPFKDCLSNPDPERGWNPARAKMLGASVLEALSYVAPFLRTDGDFWTGRFSEHEKYVKPTSNYKSLE
jgi:murein tripeptide amidase MpaA